MKIALISLGCAKNLVDGETMLGLLGSAGHELATAPEFADAVIVNTCGFIAPAQRESVETLLEVARLKEAGRIRYLIAAGCLAQRNPDELLREIPELDAVVGTGAVASLPDVLRRLMLPDGPAGSRAGAGSGQDLSPGAQQLTVVGQPGYLPQGVAPRLITTPPWTSLLKVSEGCDNRCTYCAIPGLRGPHRSRPLRDLLEEAEILAARGTKELILVGQDLTRWGIDLPSGQGGGPGRGLRSLASLLASLSEVRGIEWIRLHYLHPARVNRALLEAVAELPKACRYLDVPAQHGDDAILAAMGRGTTAASMLEMGEIARELMPQVAIRTSLIVGFPGETPEAFAATMRFLRELAPDWTAVFSYSREVGTPAADLSGTVPALLKTRRKARVQAAAHRISLRRNQLLLGERLRVLVEAAPSRATWPGGSEVMAVTGRSQREAPQVDGTVHVAIDDRVEPQHAPKKGEFVDAVITAAAAYDLYGRLVTP